MAWERVRPSVSGGAGGSRHAKRAYVKEAAKHVRRAEDRRIARKADR